MSTQTRGTLSLEVVGIPEAQARPRVFRMGPRIVTHSPKTRWFDVVYAAALAKRPSVPLDGPLRLVVSFRFPKPKSARRRTIIKTTKPDLDNLLKPVKDALTQARWWTDDGRVSHITAEKVFDIHYPAGMTLDVEIIKEDELA